MDLLQLPVTLVVKAPNQKIADTTVECDKEWSIKKLKEHLSDVYPSKPDEDQQRIIYSGRLLQDELLLKDVLRQYNGNDTVHTVHLVCSSSTEGSSPSGTSSSTNIHTTHSSNTGLRHRSNTSNTQANNQAPTTADVAAPPPTATSAGWNVSDPNAMADPQAYFNTMNNMMMQQQMPPGMYDPQQMMWMQQMYAQQMAQYMQYYTQGYTAAPVDTAVDPAVLNVANPPDNVPAAVDAGVAPGNARPGNQPPIQRMNAQGGPVMDDDEDEINRDWLDWVYTLSRFGVLISILYFYSTLHRFALVFGFFFLVYLYQAGWLRLRRRVVRQNNQGGQDAQQPQPQQQQEAAAAQQPEQEQGADQQAEAGESEADADRSEDGADEESTPPAPPPPPPPPSAVKIAWSFFCTFFTSLLPQQPQAVNGN